MLVNHPVEEMNRRLEQNNWMLIHIALRWSCVRLLCDL